ncbi:MAG: signal peptidase II [Caulobacteraceae bacterium]|nr:signal peptidase II [Caulobacteraceae bacterium]
MRSSSRPGIWAFLIAALVLALDQAAKAWIVRVASPTGVGPAIPGPVRLTLVDNTGISYGLFQGGDLTRWVLAAFALAVSIALAVWAWRAEKLATAIGLGLILGGALGNVADRVVHGAVVDFIDARAIHFPWIFNPADSAITVGIILLLLEGLFSPKKTAT